MMTHSQVMPCITALTLCHNCHNCHFDEMKWPVKPIQQK
jgi:hypothetical protein